MQKGIFLSFEGSEGCGKSTQIQLLAERLTSCGHSPLLLREPGGTPAGEIIRHLLKHSPEAENLCAEAELLLFAASRAQLVREIILPTLALGRTVITDRFLDSTTVYQGVGRKIPEAFVKSLNQFCTEGCLPTATILLDLDRESSLQRIAARNLPPDRIERAGDDFFQAVRQGYLDLAAREPQRIHVLDASLPIGVLSDLIWGIVTKL